MPRPKIECPGCGGLMSNQAKRCQKCMKPYKRTAKHRHQMSDAMKGRECVWKGKQRPEHSRSMRAWWTPERREAMRQRQLDPNARYHGLSSRQAAAIVRAAGRCQGCNHDGSRFRLGVHHIDRDKHNQKQDNLIVLCHRCHMNDHQAAGETGWGTYHWKRKMSQGSPSTSRPSAALAGPRGTPLPFSRYKRLAWAPGRSGQRRHSRAGPSREDWYRRSGQTHPAAS